MKRKRIMVINFITIYISIVFLGVACIVQKPIITQAAMSKNSISVKSDKIHWVVREFSGKKYKRLYNYTTKTWLTDWIPLD